MMRTSKLAKLTGMMIGAALLLSTAAFADVNITVDTKGSGTLVGPGGSLTLAGALAADPGPGGLSSVLTYSLLNPPDVVAGDVQLTTGGVVTDLIRFNRAGTGSAAYAASLLFYSAGNDGFQHLVNNPTPPTVAYPNIISIAKGGVYTPTPGQPGYVATIATHYTFSSALTCTYSFTPPSMNFAPAGGSGSFTVNTQTGCPIAPTTTSAFISGLTVAGNTVSFNVSTFAGPFARGGTIVFPGSVFFGVTQDAPFVPFGLTIQPARLLFTSGPTTAPPPQQVALNGGDGTPFDISVDVPWITATRAPSILPSTLTVTVDPTKAKVGTTNAGNITIITDHGNFIIPVIYQVQGLPSIVPVPAALTFNITAGAAAPASQSIKISASNLTAIPLTVTGSGFVSVSPSTGNTPLTLTVTIDTTKTPASGSATANITVTAAGVTNSPLIIPVVVNVASAPASFNALGVVNGASFLPGPLAPGSLFTIFGTNLSSLSSGVSGQPTLSGGLSNALGGVSMTIGGRDVPLAFVSSGQINAQIPVDVPLGSQSLVLNVNGLLSTVGINLASAAPGTFTINGRGAILNQDYSLNNIGNGAKSGSVIQVFFTGQGDVTPGVGSGMPASLTSLSYAKGNVTAKVGNSDAKVTFAGLAPGFVGLAQANIEVPALQSNDYSLVIYVDGVPSNAVPLTIQ